MISAERQSYGDMRVVRVVWTSDGSQQAVEEIRRCNGVILRVQFVPGIGALQPTANYDVTLLDEAGQDVLAGQGQNRSNVTTQSVCPAIPMSDGTTSSIAPIAVAGTLNLSVTNAGVGKSGTIIIYHR